MQKIVLALCLISLMASCDTGDKVKKSQIELNKALYEKATSIQDDGTAIVALNYLLLHDSANLEYMDSLSRLYIRNRILNSGLLLGKKVMKAQPDNYKTLELISEAQMALGDYNDALINLEILHKNVGDVRYLYQMAIIDSEMKDVDAFDARLDQILIDPSSANVEFPAVQGMQTVDIKAAANFLKAQLHYNSGNLEQAMSYVKKSLAISPNFQSALVAFEQIQQDKKSPLAKQKRKLSAEEIEALNYQNYLKQNPQ